MKEDIYNFPKQLIFRPEIKNGDKWGKFKNYVLAGMGGSHLAGDILKTIYDENYLHIHSDYGLPSFMAEDTGLVVASYSGNTEEVLDVFNKAVLKGIRMVVIAKGGKLLKLAKEKGIPYIQLPEENMQPRLALGHSFLALCKALGREDIEKNMENLKEKLENKQSLLEEQGKALASRIKNKIPVTYSTQRNYITASIWKINFNETTKIPAFCNFFPELNHNEMTGFDVTLSTKELSGKMVFLILKDKEDFSKNRRRAEVLKDILKKRDFEVLEIENESESREEFIFSSILLSSWTSYYLSKIYQTDPDGVPMVEEFKKMIE